VDPVDATDVVGDWKIMLKDESLNIIEAKGNLEYLNEDI